MAQPEHVDFNSIQGRVPVSYRVVADSLASADNTSEQVAPYILPRYRSLEMTPLDGMIYGESSTRLGDVLDGLSNTLMIGETYTNTSKVIHHQALDYWAFFSPQIENWSWGTIDGTEFSEAAGSTVEGINSHLDSGLDGVIREMTFGSYHIGGAFFVMGDGSVRFINEDIDLEAYRGLATRSGSEIVQ